MCIRDRLIGVTLLIVILAVIVTRRASEIFGRLQRLLDRMNVVLRENLTGVRVIRAFRKERDEEERMRKSLSLIHIYMWRLQGIYVRFCGIWRYVLRHHL